MEVWKEAVRTGSRHGPSPGGSLHGGRFMAALTSEGAGALGALRRAPSMFFNQNVAESEDDYASMFGHYRWVDGTCVENCFCVCFCFLTE